MMRPIRWLLPHPFLTLLLTVVWVLLQNKFSAGMLVFGLILGIVIPVLTARWWTDRPQGRLCDLGPVGYHHRQYPSGVDHLDQIQRQHVARLGGHTVGPERARSDQHSGRHHHLDARHRLG